MRKLNEGKVRWIIREKARGQLSTREIAMVQHVSPRWVKRLWQRYRSTGLMPFPKPSGRPRKPITSEEVAAVLNAYNRYRVNALLLEKVLAQTYGVRVSHNRVHRILRMHGRAGSSLGGLGGGGGCGTSGSTASTSGIWTGSRCRISVGSSPWMMMPRGW